MPNPARGAFPLRTVIALAAALLLLGVATASQAFPPGPSQCMNKYVQSDADDTCQNEDVTIDGNNCSFTAECRDSEGDWRNTSITVSPEEATQLNNCNGTLTLGSC